MRCSTPCPCNCWRGCGGAWHERGVACAETGFRSEATGRTSLRPPCDIAGAHDYLCAIHPPGRGLRAQSSASGLQQGTDLRLLGLRLSARTSTTTPSSATWAPVISGHRGHRSDMNPLADVGPQGHHRPRRLQRHSAVAPGRRSWTSLERYTAQARFLMNCGLVDPDAGGQRPPSATAPERLILEH
jgi:hypothetical protein